MRILFLSRWFPYPPNNGSKLRIYNLLKGLARQHEVDLISFAAQMEASSNPNGLKEICRSIETVVRKDFEPTSLNARLGIFSTVPRSVVDTYSPHIEQHILRALSTRRYDLLIASQFDMAVYAKRFKGVPALFEEVEIGTYVDRIQTAHSSRERLRHSLTWFKHRNYLRSLLKQFRACTVVSEREQSLVEQLAPRHLKIKIIPNSVDPDAYSDIKAEPEPGTLIFTGSFTYQPNYEAMSWFLKEVFPLVRAACPDVTLTITGEHLGLPLPDQTNVRLAGFVDDVREYVANSWVSLAPLQSGGGTRLKILEAMALGTPVVATSKGAEGLYTQHAEHLLIADVPSDYANAIIRLFNSPDLRSTLAKNAYRLVNEKYNWSRTIDSVFELANQIV